MAQAKLATWRISIPYTVSGVSHIARQYVKSTGTIVSGIIQVIDRSAGNQDWTTAADQFCKAFTSLLNSSNASIGTASLDNKVGSAWNQVAFHSPTNAAVATATFLASQVTIVMRDTAFNKLKLVILDTVAVPFKHSALAPTTGQVGDDLWGHYVSGGNAADPFAVAVSLSNHYLLDPAFVGLTVTGNRRTRRRRSLT